MRELAGDPLAAFRAVNVAGTRRLAEQAAAMGVRRLVYVSSIKVNGEATKPGRPFSAAEAPAPLDAYGVSKWEAEQALWEVSRQTGLEVVVVRPPLVYGPMAKGNFARLLQCVRRGIPLPLGAVDNRRSLVGIDNLVDFLIRGAEHPAASGQTFLVSDGNDLSTPGLIRLMGRATGRPARLFNFPPGLLRTGARFAGLGAEFGRLIGFLQVDIAHSRRVLDWHPPVSVEEGLVRAAQRAEAVPALPQ
jgi:nucleoside-diphosphate-sugar epimerase